MAYPQVARRRPRLAFPGTALLLFAALLGLAGVGRCGWQTQVPIDPRLPLRVTVSNWYDTSPFVGFAPLEVTIENHTGSARTWTMTTSSPQSYGRESQLNASFDFTVA